MNKSDSISITKFTKLLSPSLLVPKDTTTYQYTVDESYHTASSKYLNKLYGNIGLKSSRFMRELHELDPEYALSKLGDNLNKLSLSLYLYGNEFMVLSQVAYSTYMKLLKFINDSASILYMYESDDYTDDSYLVVDKVGHHYYIELNLCKEVIVLYNAELTDDSLYLCKFGSYDLSDKDTWSFIEMFLNSAFPMANPYSNIQLTWLEVVSSIKSLKYYSGLTDADYALINSMTQAKQGVELSTYTVGDYCRWVKSSISSVKLSNITWLYERINTQGLVFYQLL